MVAEFSGPFAQYGQQMLGGMKAYMKLNGDTVAGKKIEIVQKDTTGPSPDVAKRLAQELITRDDVNILVGFGLTPNALAVAPVATEGKKTDGDHECGDLDHHDQVAEHRARVDDASAGDAADGDLGGEERHQEGIYRRC